LGHKRTLKRFHPMSALPPIADIETQSRDVRFVQKARKLIERHGIQFLIGDGRRIGADLTGVPGRRFYFLFWLYDLSSVPEPRSLRVCGRQVIGIG